MVKRNLTGAGYGLNSWLQQRITAVIMLLGSLAFFVFIILVAVNVDAGINSWQAMFQDLFVKIFVQIFFLALILHAWVGVRDLWMDYVQNSAIKLTLHVATIIWLSGSLIYAIKVIWA